MNIFNTLYLSATPLDLNIINQVSEVSDIWFSKIKSYRIKYYHPSVSSYNNVVFTPSALIYRKNTYDCFYEAESENPIALTRPYRAGVGKDAFSQKDINNINIDEFVNNRSVYLGTIFDLYGHFILDSLSRSWILENLGDLSKYTFLFNLQKPKKDPYAYIKEKKYIDYFNALGIPSENIKILDKNTKIAHLIVPESAIRVPFDICPLQFRVWANIGEKFVSSQGTGKNKVYLSRRSLENPLGGRSLENEDEIEKYFESKGFTIIHPQEFLSAKQQHDILGHCDIIVGCSGSGLHNIIFYQKPMLVLMLSAVNANNGFVVQHVLHSLMPNKQLFSFVSQIPANDPNNPRSWRINVDDLNNSIRENEVLSKQVF